VIPWLIHQVISNVFTGVPAAGSISSDVLGTLVSTYPFLRESCGSGYIILVTFMLVVAILPATLDE
jgi:hypothetical protein